MFVVQVTVRTHNNQTVYSTWVTKVVGNYIRNISTSVYGLRLHYGIKFQVSTVEFKSHAFLCTFISSRAGARQRAWGPGVRIPQF